MSSPYQILDDRPLDQWKVTELKEELRKRKLTIGGLKQDLVKRLDEAVRIEREEASEEASKISESDPLPVDGPGDAEPIDAEIAQTPVSSGGNGIERADDIKHKFDINDSATDMNQEEVQEGDTGTAANSAGKEEDLAVFTVKTNVTVTETVVAYSTVTKQDFSPVEVKSRSENSDPQLDNEDSKSELVKEDSNPQVAAEGMRDPPMSDILDTPVGNNQVSEVGPNIGFQVSSDSLSINEKKSLKDNKIVDNDKLELDLVKPETAEPSSSNVIPDGGRSHPMDVEEPQENKLSVEEKNDDITANAEMGKDSDTADMGYSEKLNLDRSSGDDSMEEDVQESRQVDSNYESGDGGDTSGKNEVPAENEENHVDILGHGSPAEKKYIVVVEEKTHLPAGKRKLSDEGAPGIDEPVKRQRKWNTGNIDVCELHDSGFTSATAPKEPTPRRNFCRFDSKGIDDSPKERIVPPSQKPATNSLRIDNFVRPFTLKAVQELLGKTGTVTSFWMDHIKTHCYVTYSSVDEAAATRDAVYNLRWPPYGGQLLAAEFVDPDEAKVCVEAPSQLPAATPISIGTSVSQVPPSQPQPSPRQKVSRQHVTPVHAHPPPLPLSNPLTVKERINLLPPPPPPPPPPPLSNPLTVKERINLPPPPPLPEKVDPPIVTLDDLFRKTKATPRIYYLPLSEEQVAAKLIGRETSDSRTQARM